MAHGPDNGTTNETGQTDTMSESDATTQAGGGTVEQASMEEMLAELNQVRIDMGEMLDSLQRSRAEFANYRRRIEQEREQLRVRAAESIVRKLLPVADDFERALRAVPEEVAATSWFEGIRLVERKLWGVLEAEGVTPMESVGQPFDPSRHEAVMVDEAVSNADTVVEEYQRGYLVNDTVLRPAMVKVGALPEA